MEQKKFSKFVIASIKRTAQNCYPLVRKKNKLLATIEQAQEELKMLQTQIDAYQIPIKAATGGYSTEDLITRTVVDTGKVDKDGKPVTMVQWNLTYPDTVVPPVVETISVNQEMEEQVKAEIAENEAVENIGEENFHF